MALRPTKYETPISFGVAPGGAHEVIRELVIHDVSDQGYTKPTDWPGIWKAEISGFSAFGPTASIAIENLRVMTHILGAQLADIRVPESR